MLLKDPNSNLKNSQFIKSSKNMNQNGLNESFEENWLKIFWGVETSFKIRMDQPLEGRFMDTPPNSKSS